MDLPAPTTAHLLSSWTLNAVVLACLVAAGVAYLGAVWRVNRRGPAWPILRTVAFLGPGLGSVAVCTMSGLAVYNRVLLWPLAVQMTVLLTLCPVLLALGDPLRLIRATLGPRGQARWDALVSARTFRVLTFPLVGALLAVVVQFLVLFTPYAGAAARNPTVMNLLYLQMLAVGCLFALPILGVDLVPDWCTHPVRMALVGADGLLDAVPGIAVIAGSGTLAGGYYAGLTHSWSTGTFDDRHIAGGMMITLAEGVAIPLAVAVFRAWIGEDERNAREIDVVLEAAAVIDRAAAVSGDRPRVAGRPQARPTGLDRPWWETEAGEVRDRVTRRNRAADRPEAKPGPGT